MYNNSPYFRRVFFMTMRKPLFVAALLVCLGSMLFAQGSAFNYQGKLNDGAVPANGAYDFTFRLFSAPTGGAQIGSDVLSNDVPVAAGVFSVSLDFGSSPFTTNTASYLEIAVRPGAGTGAYTTLAPRQTIANSPYSISTLRAASAATADTATNAQNLGGVAANQFVQTTDPRLSDTRTPTAGSSNYIQNTISPQAASNFNVSGTGTANIFSATAQFNLAGNRFLSVGGTENLFAGINAGAANTSGQFNSFVGIGAGTLNSTGANNTFIGRGTGAANTTASNNTFVGASAGNFNIDGFSNSFFGRVAGLQNTSGNNNSFGGFSAGLSNTTGSLNSFFGSNAGVANTAGLGNSFFGNRAGQTNATGGNNTLIGFSADVSFDNLNFATAIGSNAVVSTSNTLVLGRGADTVQIPGNLNLTGNLTGNFNFNGTGMANIFNATTQFNIGGSRILGNTGTGNLFAGINAGQSNTAGTQNAFFGQASGSNNTTGGFNAFFGQGAGFLSNGSDNSFFGNTAGQANTSGSDNSFFGLSSGFNNNTGASNSFFGHAAGGTNTTGSNNTTLGSFADVSVNNLNFATAIGAGSIVSASNTLVLGRPGDAVQIPGTLSVTGTFTGTVSNATNATQLGGIAANQFVQTGDARLSDARTPTAGSSNYVQNGTSVQATSNFNVSGTGTASIFNAATQYNIGGSRVFSMPGTRNLFLGTAPGLSGTDNSFVGYNAGQGNGTGLRNTFVGSISGNSNAGGNDNSFLGFGAGQENIDGFKNSYFGSGAGQNSGNTNNNSFFGWNTGQINQLGISNSFFGADAGFSNTSGSSNTIIGYRANVVGPPPFGTPNPSNATAIGANSQVTQSNSLVLGSINGINGAAADTNVGIGTTAPLSRVQVVTANDTNPGTITAWDSRHFVTGGTASSGGVGISYDQTNNVGYFGTVRPNVAWGNLVLQSGGGNVGIGTGTSAPTHKLEITDSSNTGVRIQNSTAGGTVASFGGTGAFWVDLPGVNAGRFIITESGNVGINTNNPLNKLDVAGVIAVGSLGSAGSTTLCRNASLQISTCSSSIRYKRNIDPFNQGLSLIEQLRPVSFNWKDGGMRDMGLVAEEVNKVEPLLTTVNDKGEVEGVKYDRVGVVLINAVKQQQAQIEAQQKQIEQQNETIKKQRADFDALKALVCTQNASTAVCKPQN